MRQYHAEKRAKEAKKTKLTILGQLLDGNHLEPSECNIAEILIEALTAELKSRMG